MPIGAPTGHATGAVTVIRSKPQLIVSVQEDTDRDGTIAYGRTDTYSVDLSSYDHLEGVLDWNLYEAAAPANPARRGRAHFTILRQGTNRLVRAVSGWEADFGKARNTVVLTSYNSLVSAIAYIPTSTAGAVFEVLIDWAASTIKYITGGAIANTIQPEIDALRIWRL